MAGRATLTTNFPAAGALVRARVVDTAAKLALEIENLAKQFAPVDTGFLRSSIAARHIGGGVWEVVVSAEYAGHVEFGTRFMAAQPFVRPAVEAVKAAIGGMSA